MGFYTKKQLMLESINIIIFLIMIFSAFYFYNMLPEKIPIHWNASGEVNGYGSRNSVFILPFVYLGIYLLILFLPTIDVYRDNVKKSYKNYFGIRLSLGIFFLIVYLSTTLVNFYDFDASRILLISISLLFISIGYFIKDIKRNYFAGIRTPWALSNDRVWTETHSMSGKLFMSAGALLAILTSFVSMIVAFYLMISLIIIISIYSVAYSYVLYKRYNGKIYKK
jgi:uncharacterized membrane protein